MMVAWRMGAGSLPAAEGNSRPRMNARLVVRGLCAAGPLAAAKAPDLTKAIDHAPVRAIVRPSAEADRDIRDRAPRVSR